MSLASSDVTGGAFGVTENGLIEHGKGLADRIFKDWMPILREKWKVNKIWIGIAIS